MADIELVIKIPEEEYSDFCKRYIGSHNIVINAVCNGTPLPKGHGDLIDRDNLLVDSYYTCDLSGNEINIVEVTTVEMADAIIEADKEYEDETDKSNK